MKNIGDNLRQCTDGLYSLENFLQIGDKVLTMGKETIEKETMANYQY